MLSRGIQGVGETAGSGESLALHLPLDVFITRKIGSPENPEYALGALSETGNIYLNPDAVAEFRLSYEDIEDIVSVQRAEISRRQRLYRLCSIPQGLSLFFAARYRF